MLITSPLLLKIRSVARRSGLTSRAVGWFRKHLLPSYEYVFDKALLENIGPEDVVWDVGANVGFYSTRFAERARQVIAFEPSPSSAEKLADVVKGLGNVEVRQVALSSEPGEAEFFVRDDGYSWGTA